MPGDIALVTLEWGTPGRRIFHWQNGQSLDENQNSAGRICGVEHE
jgi:hypothetical protein